MGIHMEIRELIFRGFHPCDGPDTIVVDGETVKGRWVEGYFVKADGQINNGQCYILPDIADFSYGDGGNRIRIGCFVEVLPSTVGQYTGLDDSDGRKVFEGDILRFTDEPNDYEWTGRIEFGNPNGGYTWGFQIVHMSGPEPNIDTLCWFDMEEGGAYSRVIGTVFDVDESTD